MSSDFVETLVNELENTASWRREKAREHVDDERNRRAAETLDRLAQELRALPESNTNLLMLENIAREFTNKGGSERFDLSDAVIQSSDYRRRIGFSIFRLNVTDYLTTLIAIYSTTLNGGGHSRFGDSADSIRQLKSRATELRSKVVRGEYDDKDLTLFWHLTAEAGPTLHIPNSDLSMRAGLGDGYFMAVSREKRRPKLTNFLKALSTIIDVADERLTAIEKAKGSTPPARSNRTSKPGIDIAERHVELTVLARSLSELAVAEIERLNSQLPNDPDAIDANRKQVELLSIFSNGFEKIADALALLESRKNAPALAKAKGVVGAVGKQVNQWFIKNGAEVVDWTVRIPAFAIGVELLNLVGADVHAATPAIAVLVGGNKVVSALKNAKKD